MKRKAAEAEVLSLPKPKKRHLTSWNLHLKKCATTEGSYSYAKKSVIF